MSRKRRIVSRSSSHDNPTFAVSVFFRQQLTIHIVLQHVRTRSSQVGTFVDVESVAIAANVTDLVHVNRTSVVTHVPTHSVERVVQFGVPFVNAMLVEDDVQMSRRLVALSHEPAVFQQEVVTPQRTLEFVDEVFHR